MYLWIFFILFFQFSFDFNMSFNLFTLKHNAYPSFFNAISIRNRTIRLLESKDVNNEKENIKKAMENARVNSKTNTSPGAGLLTAEEQSEAAYADLINTTMDQRLIR